jgi:outer membrane immunogenic protein
MRVRVFVLTAIVAAVLSAGLDRVASAADLGRRAVAPLVYDWTGLYVGVDVGYHWSSVDVFLPGAAAAGTAAPDPDSFTIGGHIGYRHQFPNRFVVGVEGDLAWLDGDETGAFPGAPTAGVNARTEWDASVRGILGFAFDRTLIYATGGVSWLRAEGCGVLIAAPTACVAGTNISDTLTGWTIGGGAAFAFSPNLIARIEYLHADYGSNTYTTPGFTGGLANVDVTTDKVRVGLSWKFGPIWR